MTLRPGEPWGEPTSRQASTEVRGADRDLALAAGRTPGSLVRFHPENSDLARTIGLYPDLESRGIALPIDGITFSFDHADAPPSDPSFAVNMLVIGMGPRGLRAFTKLTPVRVTVDGRHVHNGPATTIVIANGQFLGSDDLVPRGHPGDGRLEVQVYSLAPFERKAMRDRLSAGIHVPHSGITTASGREIEVEINRGELSLHSDRHLLGSIKALTASIIPDLIHLLV